MDIARRFSATPTTYVRWLNLSMEVAPCLSRRGKGRNSHVVHDGGEMPRWASFEALFDEIECGNDPATTGLEDEEFPVFIARWTRNRPVDPSAVAQIVRAITTSAPLRIHYVGMRRGERARWRTIWPIGIERMGDQWRVIGLDLDKNDTPVRVFVLARILGAEPSTSGTPAGFVEPSIHDVCTPVPATLNPSLTPDQRIAIANELGIRDGVVHLNARGVFEFYRRFGAQKLSGQAVWPPIINAAPDKEG